MGDSYVCSTALMTCTFGLVPCPLVVNPARNVFLSGLQRANIGDFVPITNIASFGMCSAPTNPAVIAATAAAMGVFTPAPCVPAIVSPWIPGKPDVLIQGMPALTRTSRNVCMWLGQISFTNDGQIPMPPPICTPPIGSMSCMMTGVRLPLTKQELGGLSEDDREQYEDDMAEAEKAGGSDKMVGDALDKAADDYEKKGEPEKAAAARKGAEQAHKNAEDKKNMAMGDVNQKYREKERKTELGREAKKYVSDDISKEELLEKGICKNESEVETFQKMLREERRDYAYDFYKRNSKSPDKGVIMSKINGIDLNKPVKVKQMPPPDRVYRYQYPGQKDMKGDFCFSPEVGKPMPTGEQLGIHQYCLNEDGTKSNKELRCFIVAEDAPPINYLESTAKPGYKAPIDGKWDSKKSGSNWQLTEGGATQMCIGEKCLDMGHLGKDNSSFFKPRR